MAKMIAKPLLIPIEGDGVGEASAHLKVLKPLPLEGDDRFTLGVEYEIGLVGTRVEWGPTPKDPAVDKAADEVEALIGQHVMLKTEYIEGGIGFEIAAVYGGLSQQPKIWKPFFDNRPKGLTLVGPNIGMHVHAGKAGQTPEMVARSYKFLSDNREFATDVAGRNIGNLLGKGGGCNPLPQTRNFTLNATSWAALHASMSGLGFTIAIERHYPKAIEWRLFQTPLKWEDFMKNLELVEALPVYCEEHEHPTLAGLKQFCKTRPRYEHLYAFLAR